MNKADRAGREVYRQCMDRLAPVPERFESASGWLAIVILLVTSAICNYHPSAFHYFLISVGTFVIGAVAGHLVRTVVNANWLARNPEIAAHIHAGVLEALRATR